MTPSAPGPGHRRPPQNVPFAGLGLAVALLLTPVAARAQGCAQCQDNTAATPPATQAGYRHAIVFMTIAAGGLFAGTLFLFKRHR